MRILLLGRNKVQAVDGSTHASCKCTDTAQDPQNQNLLCDVEDENVLFYMFVLFLYIYTCYIYIYTYILYIYIYKCYICTYYI